MNIAHEAFHHNMASLISSPTLRLLSNVTPTHSADAQALAVDGELPRRTHRLGVTTWEDSYGFGCSRFAIDREDLFRRCL